MTAEPPRWSSDQLEEERLQAIELFRAQRMEEPLEGYLEHFDAARSRIENLLEITVDLSELGDHAVEILTDVDLLEALRYLAGPPISTDDLKTLSDASLSAKALKEDSDIPVRVISTVLLGLDRNRFPWVAEDREPTEMERGAAALATASLIASRRVMTGRANESKTAQENLVKQRLRDAGFVEVLPRDITTLVHAPGTGEFCGESLFGPRKADIVVRLWDQRVLALECKVSSSSTNSVKRLNNDAAVKAREWLQAFGTAQTVPAALLAGVFKRHNLEQAQGYGLSLFWSHSLDALTGFVAATRG